MQGRDVGGWDARVAWHLVEGRLGDRGRGALDELGQASAASGLGAVDITLGVGDHGVLEGREVESVEAEHVVLIELGLLLLGLRIALWQT
jgi:hypothetical protein